MSDTTPRKRQRIDWEAVERDYRTGKFTKTEVSAKHGIDPAQLSRKIKTDQALDKRRWQTDLSDAVRQATNANLMSELVKSEIKDGQAKVKDAVLAAAEVNTQVILRHRGYVSALASVYAKALATVDALMDSTAELKDAALALSAVESASRTVKNLIEKERQAFRITDDDGAQGTRRTSIQIEFVEPGSERE